MRERLFYTGTNYLIDPDAGAVYEDLYGNSNEDELLAAQADEAAAIADSVTDRANAQQGDLNRNLHQNNAVEFQNNYGRDVNDRYWEGWLAETEWYKKKEQERLDEELATQFAAQLEIEFDIQQKNDEALALAVETQWNTNHEQDRLDARMAAELAAEMELEETRQERRDREIASILQALDDEDFALQGGWDLFDQKSTASEGQIAIATNIKNTNAVQARKSECYICLEEEGVITLKCNHTAHTNCVKAHLHFSSKQAGGEVLFSAARCGECRQWLSHPTLDEKIQPIKELYGRVSAVANEYYSRRLWNPIGGLSSSEVHVDDYVEAFVNEFVFYYCGGCSRPYCGGRRQASQTLGQLNFPLADLRRCAMCLDQTGQGVAPCLVANHGTDYSEFKCSYCCSPATVQGFGTVPLCDACCLQAGCNRIRPCPGPKVCTRAHPPNDGTGHFMGCGLCSNWGGH